jgi:hypothetical protein
MRPFDSLNAFLFDELSEHARDSQRVPQQGCSGKFIDEGIGPIDHRSEFDNVRIEDVRPYLRLDMQQNLQVPLTQRLLIHYELSQLNQPDSQNVMRDVRLENLVDVVQNSLCVEVFVDVQGGRLVLVLRQQDGLENYQALRPHLPPRVTHQSF